MPAPRGIVLALALIATLAAALIEPPEPAVEPPVSAGAVPADAATPAARSVAQTGQAPRERFAPPGADLFAVQSWRPPPAPARVAATRAPALPFLYLGQVQEDGEIMVFLGQGEHTHLLRKGDALAEYRVVDITPARMTFVYLPLNEQQHLTFDNLP